MHHLTKPARVKVAAILGLLLFVVVGQSLADADNSPWAQLSALQAQVSALEDDRDALLARVEALEEGAGDLQAVQQSVETLEDLLAHFSCDGNDIFITGANLHVVNGLESTETTNGLGNVIIGYNESRESRGYVDDRSGSHMLVAGHSNNYSGCGGIVVGYWNTASGFYSSVSGGVFNTASGFYSSVSGGNLNTASGFYSSVSGGSSNTASGFYSSVSGGNSNTASGGHSSVSGGHGNTASGNFEHPNTHTD